MIRGTVRQQPLLPTNTSAFHSAVAIVQWWLVGGRAALGEVRGVDYTRQRSDTRNAHGFEQLQVKFALVVQATSDLTPRQKRLVELSYRDGVKDADIGAALGIARRTIVRERHQALRVVHQRAQELGLIQRENP